MSVYATDCETSGLIEQMMEQDNPKLHNLCSIDIETGQVVLFEGNQRDEIQSWLDQGHTFITHNCKTFDAPALEFLGYDTSKVKWIDSLLLSWYLEPDRMRHGLAEYGEDFGVPKPVIEDWENQTQEEYNHRVTEDCKIQRKLWLKQESRLNELYPDKTIKDKLIAYLMWKGDCLRIQQDTGWHLDEVAANKLEKDLADKIEEKTNLLIKVMPKVPVYVVRNRPAKPFKKCGELSASGIKWKDLTESRGLPFEHTEPIKVVTEYLDGNPASHVQMKDWLNGIGWKPETFKYEKKDDGTTKLIPQINLKGGEVCNSVKDLIAANPGVEHIAGLGILNHRYSVVKGFIREAFRGKLTARSQGFTNTIRMQHRLPMCNLPSTRVAYGEEIRSLLVSEEGMVLLGADLSGVENFIKNHFQWKLDPEYVKTQLAPGFDPHLLMATSASLMSEEDAEWYKWYKKLDKEQKSAEEDARFHKLDLIRATGKTASYSLQYGAGVETVARSCKVPESVARKLHKAYAKLNWSVDKIASMMTVKSTSFGNWQLNPINKFWYSLRSQKDRFSTLVQGTAAYVFDIWLYQCKRLADKRGLDYNLMCQFHDDQALRLPEEMRTEYEALVRDALKAVNNSLKLHVELKCDVMFGYNGAEIH